MSRRYGSARVNPRAEVHRVYWRHRRHLPESWTSSPLLRRRHPDVHCHSTVEAHTVAPRVVLDDFNWMQPRLKSSGSAQSSRDCLSDADKAIVIASETIQPVESVVTSASISTLNLTCRRTLLRQHKPASSACVRYVVCSAVTLVSLFHIHLMGIEASAFTRFLQLCDALLWRYG